VNRALGAALLVLAGCVSPPNEPSENRVAPRARHSDEDVARAALGRIEIRGSAACVVVDVALFEPAGRDSFFLELDIEVAPLADSTVRAVGEPGWSSGVLLTRRGELLACGELRGLRWWGGCLHEVSGRELLPFGRPVNRNELAFAGVSLGGEIHWFAIPPSAED
jgi:hypothetical protein